MRWIYLAIGIFLAAVFLRADVQLVDLILNANLLWSFAAATFFIGILVGQSQWSKPRQTRTIGIAGWGLFAVLILALLEYSLEWNRQTLVAENRPVILSAASVQTMEQHAIPAKEGLFRATAMVNGIEISTLVDTGATLVLLNYSTAERIGIDVDVLAFDTPVKTVSDQLDVAKITLDQVQIGKILLRNVEAAITPKDKTHDNLLGASFLARLDAAVFRKNLLLLRQAK